MITKERKVLITVGVIISMLSACLCLLILLMHLQARFNGFVERDVEERLSSYSVSSYSSSYTTSKPRANNEDCNVVVKPSITDIDTVDAYLFNKELRSFADEFEFDCGFTVADNYDSFAWKRADGWYVTENAYTGAELGIGFEYDMNTDVDSVLTNHAEAASEYIHSLQDLFIHNGFSEDPNNTLYNTAVFEGYTQNLEFSEIGYSKNSLDCKIVVTPNQFGLLPDFPYDSATKSIMWSYLVRVLCSDRLEANFAEQKPFLELINDQTKAIAIDWEEGEFTQISTYSPAQNPTLIFDEVGLFKNTNGTLEKIYMDASAPDCDLVDNLGIKNHFIYCSDKYTGEYREAREQSRDF